ncbi:gelsolin, cytoplasmic-like [Centruroides sculpturatus]|uniref:gelsolin, cytoplasmic-like n=1 Tax=Centruroides sculpturatus TaxID=218467 RepID=UPI000C6E1EE0|nr:gelsolin, cytoplasmic-like [Centruroides sculpturatus]
MAGVDPAFRAIPKNATYFVIWRIENMQVVPLARDHYGTFYTGDSYIVVCITESGEKGDSMMKIREVKGILDVHIHFWLGAQTSQDEAGVAAYKTVELDDYLGGTPVQHREVQGWESKRFLSYFKKGIRLLEGGIVSGISNINNNIKAQMFKVRGKQRPVVQQLPEIDWQFMDDGAVYIICIHSVIFVWTGRNANVTEKIQGVKVAQQMKLEFGSGTVILVEDGKEQSLPKIEKEVFCICVDEGGTLKVTEVKTGPIDQSDLDVQNSYIIDNGEAGIWVWVGKKASTKERTEAMRNAQGFIKKKGYPNHIQVTRVIDGGEPSEFKAQFRSWRDAVPTPAIGKQHNIGITESGEKGDSMMKIREVKGILDVHIHFWLGAQTSQDEAGVAAYKTVELDDYLGGTPVQHREVQGWESKRFLSYFKKGIRLLEGGIVSGISNINNNIKAQMFKVRGKQRPVVQQLPEIDWQFMDDGAVYIICIHSVIFVWTGRNANVTEKIQGVKVAQQMKLEFGSGTVILVEDGKEQSLPKIEKENSYIIDNGEAGIWVWVGKKASTKERTEAMRNAQGFIKKKGYPNHIQVTRVIDGGEPSEFKAQFRSWRDAVPTPAIGKQHNIGKIAKTVQTKFDAATLHSNRQLAAQSQMVDDGMGSKEVFCVEQTDLIPLEAREHGKFYSGNCYVILYAFSTEERDHFMIYYWIGNESKKEEQEISAIKTVELDRRLKELSVLVTKTVQTKFDAATLHSNRQLAAQSQMVDDGMGSKEVFCVEQTDLIPLEAREHGKFYSGNCYVILYAFSTEERDHFMIYYWIGNESKKEEQEISAIKTVELDRRLKELSVLTRVIEGKEPPHFLALFRGKMMIFQGRTSIGTRNGISHNKDQSYLLHVQGTSEFTTKANQVQKCASSLNSYDVFVLLTKEIVYVWAGKRSTGDEREMAKRIASQSGREMVLVSEGQEREDFWNAIGGKKPYNQNIHSEEEVDTRQARFYQCTINSGHLDVHEILGFDQHDLVEDDLVILDAWNVVFIWLGHCIKTEERRLAVLIAEEYLSTDPTGRDCATPITVVKQGYEPPNFTGFFPIWDDKFWKKKKTYEQIKIELAEENSGVVIAQKISANQDLRQEVDKFPIEVLQIKDPEHLPQGIDPSHKEIHLIDDDFEQIFGMTYTQFQGLPRWKQLELKKAVDLF